MADVLFTNVRIFDGSGTAPYPGEVLVQGNRIRRVARAAAGARTSVTGVTVVDGAGATLMPGMVEAHTHFSWNDQPGLSAIQRIRARDARSVPAELRLQLIEPLAASPNIASWPARGRCQSQRGAPSCPRGVLPPRRWAPG